jgi:CO/xanthine dehydrogenase FAD-binding subunit
MIVDYYRPNNLEEALRLLNQPDRTNIPLAGGTAIDRYSKEDLTVIDLQDLNLNQLQEQGSTLEVGATTSLQDLLNIPQLNPDFKKAILHEATHNLRQIATVAGTLVSASGRSPFATACLALDVTLLIAPGEERMAFGGFLNLRREILRGRLITQISLPINVTLRYEYVARTPADLPIVCVAVAQWPSGRTRVALGGFDTSPKLAMDGPECGGADIAAMDAYSQAGDQWASADYRQAIAGVLARRCLSGSREGDNG